MELVRKNIHMNRQKGKSVVQLTLDDDFIVPDIKPDMDKIIEERGDINIQDVKVSDKRIIVSGILNFNILYLGDGDSKPIHNIEGKIPFEEIVNMDEALEGDSCTINWEIEDLSTSIINSRKLSVKALLTLLGTVENIYDEETAVGVGENENVLSMNKNINISQIAINKKDTYRIKDELTIPANKPNMFEILFNDVNIRNSEVRLLADKINVKGDIQIFILYSGEEDDNPVQYIEMELPFNGMVDCNGSNEDMISNICLNIVNKEIEIKPDADGEERVIGLEIVLELDIKAYEDEQLEILNDVYASNKELIPSYNKAHYENLIVKNNFKTRVVDRLKIDKNQAKIMQICHASGSIKVDDAQIVDNGIEVEGAIYVHLLYIAADDKRPLNAVKGMIPFSVIVDAKGISKSCTYDIKPMLEQVNANMIDSEEIEIRASINLNTLVFDKIVEDIIVDVKEENLDMKKLQEMPGIVGYIVKAGDSLWKIAKKYHTTVDNLKQTNELDSDLIKPGDRLIIIKQVDSIV